MNTAPMHSFANASTPHPLRAGDFLHGAVPPKVEGDPAAGPMPKLSEFDYIPGARKAEGGTQHEQLTRQAEKWVAQTFFGTLLKQMRESPFKSEMFDGGRGGEAFASMYDQRLADRMSRGAGQKLVRGIVRQIEGRKAYGKQTEMPKQSDGADLANKVRIHVAPSLRA